jgi:uncharacterized Zn-binding protein involved in type VI secretion
MGQPAAKRGDRVVAVDTHIVMVPGTPPVPTPLPHPFEGALNGALSPDVSICGQPAATTGSLADNAPPHVPNGPGTFQRPPANKATVQQGSTTVLINGKPAARAGDKALTCNDPADLPIGTILVTDASVLIG